ncbi:hypothetical protein H4Q26_012268 [Puccinia striiformis f. sp. tritici PST-130]|nr:hypothetical protein H4Q26_012268 [Puccinia striiformis f. sp. tritici PST-130]
MDKRTRRHLEEQAMVVQFTSDLHQTQSKNPHITIDHDSFIASARTLPIMDVNTFTYRTNLQIRPTPIISSNGHKLQIKLQLDLI